MQLVDWLVFYKFVTALIPLLIWLMFELSITKGECLMKIKSTIAVGLLSVVLGGSLVGCAATPTQESTGQYVDSSAITTKVKTALVATKGINSTDISVDTYKGTVQLSGFVDTQAQKALAEKSVRSVKGVTKVVNNIIVKNT